MDRLVIGFYFQLLFHLKLLTHHRHDARRVIPFLRIEMHKHEAKTRLIQNPDVRPKFDSSSLSISFTLSNGILLYR